MTEIKRESYYGYKIEIPKDATHIETELDYSSCYYQGDMPETVIIFYKEEK